MIHHLGTLSSTQVTRHLAQPTKCILGEVSLCVWLAFTLVLGRDPLLASLNDHGVPPQKQNKTNKQTNKQWAHILFS